MALCAKHPMPTLSQRPLPRPTPLPPARAGQLAHPALVHARLRVCCAAAETDTEQHTSAQQQPGSSRASSGGASTSGNGGPSSSGSGSSADGLPQLEGLDRAYCDEFVCTSSPAVETTVRALARDLTRLNTWTTSLFSADVKYKDKYRSFRGVDKYSRNHFAHECVADPKVLVTRMAMLDKSSAQLEWRLRGRIAVFPIDVAFRDTFTLNLLTGRVEKHREEWDASACSFPARLAFNASRTAWSTRQATTDAREGGSKLLSSLSMDEGDGNQDVFRDPSDPTRFFQQDDNTFNDALTFGTLLALLWLATLAWRQLDQLH